MKRDSDIASQVKAETTAILYRENRQGLIMSFLVISMVSLILSTQINFLGPLMWWLCLSGILIVRVCLLMKFQVADGLASQAIDHWYKAFTAGALLFGLSWGMAVPFFASQLEFQSMLIMVMVMLLLFSPGE